MLLFVAWTIDAFLSVLVMISRLRLMFGLGEPPTISAMETARQARLKILSPAAQQALAEAEQRRRDKRAASNSHGNASEPR
jgi:hypothetical protein